MADVASFQLHLQGGLTDAHEFEAYDGFSSLAGAAWTLSLVTNFVETGKIRHRGDFIGRHAVRARPMRTGSLIAEFSVLLTNEPAAVFGIAGGTAATSLLYGLVQRVIKRNIGDDDVPLNDATSLLLERRNGDVEALVAATEPSLRQSHEVIGNGAQEITWRGGFNTLAQLDQSSKEYIKGSFEEDELVERTVTVNGFYGNTGNGNVFDPVEGRAIPISMSVDSLKAFGSIFSWGLDQYMNKTGRKVLISFTRVVAANGRPKRYRIIQASITHDDDL